MLTRRALRGWRQMLVNQGVLTTMRTGVERLKQRFRRSPPASSPSTKPAAGLHEGTAVHPFDMEFDVDTSGLIWGEHLASGSANDQWSTAYYGIAPSIFTSVMDRIYEHTIDAAFVDMGSGKGRAVMLATRYPFAEVHGIELSPPLHAIAQANLARMQQRQAIQPKVQLQAIDAAEYDFPLRPLVLFFYHPFCKPVLIQVLMRLYQSLEAHPRAVHIVYVNTELRDVLDRAPFLNRMFAGTLSMSSEDQLADRVGSTQEDCAIYAATVRFS